MKLNISLDEDESVLLLMLLGYAVGTALKNRDPFAMKFVDLANKMNRDNPNWTPYEIPKDQLQ
jgi:hypothetical protein